MIRLTTFILFAFVLIHFSNVMQAQQVGIGSWKSYFTYNTASTIEKVGNKIYSGSNHMLEYNMDSKEYTTYSKVNGLSDIAIQTLRYDPVSDLLIIIYENSNIDLFQNNSFVNIPDIKNRNTIGSKKINSVFFKNKLAYLCTDFGIVVLNPEKREIKESYILQANASVAEIKGLANAQGKFFAATSLGLFVADETSNALQDFSSWTLVNPTPFIDILSMNDSMYLANKNQIFSWSGNSLTLKYQTASLFTRLRKGQNHFYTCESGNDIRRIMKFDALGTSIDSFYQVNPLDMVEGNGQEIWEADLWEGSAYLNGHAGKTFFQPKGVYSNATYNLRIQQNDLYVMSGRETAWIAAAERSGFSKLDANGNWTYYNQYVGTPAMDSVVDILDIAVDNRNGTIYGASFVNGLWEYKTNNTVVNYNNETYFQKFGNLFRTVSLQFDENYNLWISNYGADDQLVVKKNDGTWQRFKLPYSGAEKSVSQIVIDNANQKWVMAPRGIGLFVYNDNNSIDNKNDDEVKYLRVGAGYGNLPNNRLNCIEKDKNGKIWVGTADGIGIFNCPESVMSTSGCDAELKIVKYDLDAGLLFQDENVKTIATDGANNKWIGTSNGVWQISDDAESILQRFDVNNSPLPSNEINRIVVHPQSGEVFIATERGMVSYRGNATEGASTNDELLVFPNPVASDYSGLIAIKGLVENADVKITDVSGQLVYRTKAQGGQAVWNGKNYTGNRPRTGVYYVFVTNADGSQSKSGKFIFNE